VPSGTRALRRPSAHFLRALDGADEANAEFSSGWVEVSLGTRVAQREGIEKEAPMFSRALAILIAPWLPTAALILSFGPAHTANDLIAGSLAVVLSAFALVGRRVSFAVGVVAGWVALTGFLFPSTPLEKVVAVSWGVTMFTCVAGPFSESPRVQRVAAPPLTPPASVPTEGGLPLAA